MKDSEKIWNSLREEAQRVREHAYAPYSHFKVGAALLGANGTVYTGCNVENASYGATICAERAAFLKAISEGTRQFQAIAIVGGLEGKARQCCPPCGICRQVMSEFCSSDFPIVLEDEQGKVKVHTLSELLPGNFSSEYLGKP